MKTELENILMECGIEKDDLNCQDFIKAGVMDSMMVADIVIAIEDRFCIEIDGEDIVPEWFVNILTIEELVNKYKNI